MTPCDDCYRVYSLFKPARIFIEIRHHNPLRRRYEAHCVKCHNAIDIRDVVEISEDMYLVGLVMTH